MADLILYIAASLDGYIARTNGDVDWLFTDQDYGYEEFSASIGAVIMGGKTYDQVLTFGDYPYADKTGFVISRSRHEQRNEQVEFIGENWPERVKQLKQGDRNIWLIGGSQIIRECLAHRLIDQIILSIHPIILGEGIPLVMCDPQLETSLQLQAVKPYDSGLIQATYQIIYPVA